MSESLIQLQRRFRREIQPEAKLSDDANSWLHDGPPVPLERRVEVYRYAIWARMEESLEEDFEEVRAQLGEKRFSEITRKYLDAYPSHYASLGEVSGSFPDFIAKEAPQSHASACLEWAKILAALGEDRPSNLGEMATLSEDEMSRAHFLVTNSAQFLPGILIFRLNGREVVTRELSDKQKILLDAIAQRKTLKQLSEVSQAAGISDEEAAQWFQTWTAEGVIVGIQQGRATNA